VELAVVIATLALVAAMLLPALAGTKVNSKSIQCLNNLKQLAKAWTMYADDNSDLLVNLSTYPTSGTMSAANAPWRTAIIGGYMSVSFPAGVVFNTPAGQKYMTEMAYKQPVNNTGAANIINGPLYSYAPYADIMHCPADFRATLPYGTGYSGPYQWDSYLGVDYLNGESTGFIKRTQILHPAGRLIWVETGDMRGEGFGTWQMGNYGTPANNFSTAQFVDSPAAFHEAAANFNFCDGHVEMHKWVNLATVALANSTSPSKENGSYLLNADSVWVGSHYPGPQNP